MEQMGGRRGGRGGPGKMDKYVVVETAVEHRAHRAAGLTCSVGMRLAARLRAVEGFLSSPHF